MFSLSEIKTVHSKVKSGADFPQYVQDLIQMGVHAYDTYVADGRACYIGENDFELSSEAKYPQKTIALISQAELFKKYLEVHQKGETDYPTFCQHAAECGIEKWRVNLKTMTCTYFDRNGNKLLEETIGS